MRMILPGLMLFASIVVVEARDLQFPKVGTPYREAKAMLLKQGLFVGPEKVGSPDTRFPEIGCWGQGKQHTCRANFVQTQPDGWGWYVVVQVNSADLRVEYADYAKTVDGLPAIPPPRAKDIPPLAGDYNPGGRDRLRALGFTPIPTLGKPSEVCKDHGCKQYMTLPETVCSGTGMSFCDSFWLAPDKRVLKVTTIGEFPRIHNLQWSSRGEQRRDTDH